MTNPAIGTPFSLSLRFKALRTALVSGSAYIPLSMLLRAQSLNTSITYDGSGPVVIAPVNIALPAISGTAQEGQILTASTGSWSNGPVSYAYQWNRDGVPVAGAINSSRTTLTADVGHVLSCTVTATNTAGSTAATSAATVSVIAAAIAVPVNSVAPAVTGTPTVGQVLMTDNGTWSGSPTGYTYQWRRAGVDISGATASTYMLVTADGGQSITCRVLATNGGGSTGAVSNAVAVAAVVAAPIAPGYIATVTSAPYAAYGAQRVVSGYSGPLYQLRRASDAATMDVSPQTGGDYPDYAVITTWAAGSALTVATIYDQTGNGRHLTQATVANQPSFDPTQKVGNVVPILIDGYGRSSTSGLPQPVIAKTPSVGGLALNAQSMSVFQTIGPKVSFNNDAYAQFSDDGQTTNYIGYFGGSNGTLPAGSPAQAIRVVSTTHTNLKPSPISPSTSGFVTFPTGTRMYTGSTETTDAVAVASQAIARMTLGYSIPGTSTFNGMYRLFAEAVYSATLSSADAIAVRDSLNAAHAVPTTYDYAVTFDGDSIMEGSGGLLLRSTPSWLAEGLTKRVLAFSTAIHGQKLADIYANRTSRFPGVYQAGLTNVIFVEAGTNDLSVGGTSGATLYSGTAAPLVAYLKGLGFKVAICTILTRSDAAYTTGVATERGNYNAAVIANTAGADYVLDLTQNPVMGDAANNSGSTTYYADKLHPTALGYRYLAGAPSGTYASAYTYYYALQQVLGVTP